MLGLPQRINMTSLAAYVEVAAGDTKVIRVDVFAYEGEALYYRQRCQHDFAGCLLLLNSHSDSPEGFRS